jgi:DNA primase
MIEIGNNIINEDVSVIIDKLKFELDKNGIKRFYKSIDTPKNYMICCPFHKDGQEKKPSMGILKSDGTCHCFACGWVGSLPEMISNCLGYDDMGVQGSKWLVQNFLTVQIENRTDIDLDMDRSKKLSNNNTEFVSEDVLDTYRYIHPYMYERKMTDKVIEIFDVGYDKETQCLTFPNRDVNGNCLFVARRSVKSKFFNYPSDVEKPVYGLYELSQLDKFPDEVWICESMINAITCWVYGKYAVALNGTGTQYQYSILRRMPNRTFVLALDPDDAGNDGRRKLKKALANKIVYEAVVPEGKDINNLSQDEFNNLKVLFN